MTEETPVAAEKLTELVRRWRSVEAANDVPNSPELDDVQRALAFCADELDAVLAGRAETPREPTHKPECMALLAEGLPFSPSAMKYCNCGLRDEPTPTAPEAKS